MLIARLAELEDAPRFGSINAAIEDLSSEREPEEPAPPFIMEHRKALDLAFSQNTVEEIIQTLDLIRSSYDDPISTWARDTIATLRLRSPTSLKVALEAIRRGKKMSLKDCLNMELKIATAFCVSHSIHNIVSCLNPSHFSAVRVVILPRVLRPF